MRSVRGRSERKLIVLNELSQPIGPTELIVKELGSFLGTLARNETFCPINAEIEIIETQESEDGSQSSVDAFAEVIGPDHLGRVRLYGCEVTKTLWKQKMGDSRSYSNVTDEMIYKKIEEMEERMQQRMQEKFNVQKDAMEQDIIMNIIAQLQRLNTGLTLDPNMLRLHVRLPGEEASIQLINCPSADSNNQG
ncbi:hypothetical protein HAX54_049449 [Datura stramonium]|uniref:Uncharacterized protein n=1 Tax=Datura stramonium TaxID=4076 RepID=A0ABS8SV27_DATST|nr:hypothetical protein [Datura stramonium]